MKLTLRELLLLVSLVAVGCGWWRQSTEAATQYCQLKQSKDELSLKLAGVMAALDEDGLAAMGMPPRIVHTDDYTRFNRNHVRNR